MLLKDRVILITNVEKFAGHGTTEVALAQGATVLAHDPRFRNRARGASMKATIPVPTPCRPSSPRPWSSWR